MIKAYFEAEVNFNPALYNYVWECMGNTATTSTPKVLLSLPSFHCNTPITISVKAQSGKALWPGLQFSNNVQLDTDEEETLPPLLRNIIYDELTFTPTCDVKFVSIDWCNNCVIPTYNDAPLPGKTFIVVSTQMQGLNGKDVIARLYNEHYEISRAGKVTNNLLDFFFFVSEQFLNGSNKSNVKLELSHQNKIIHSVDKEIEQPKTVITPNDSNPIQPVMVGTVNIVENNYLPCKYTKIIAKYPVGDSTPQRTIFDESLSTQAKPICLVGGTKEVEFTLVEYDTAKCRYKKEEEGSHIENKATITGQESIAISKNGKFNVEAKYDYGASKLISTAAFKYFWPNSNSLIRKHKLQIDTCRHSKEIAINLYPDIKWEVGLNAKLAPDKYTFRNFPPGAVYNKAKKAAQEANRETLHNLKSGDAEAEFELVIGCEYNDEEFTDEFGYNISKEIADFLKILLKIKQCVDKIFAFANGKLDKDSNSKNKAVASVGKAGVSFTVHMPNIEFLGSWQAACDDLNQIYTKGEISLAAKPLIGVEISVDLWQIGAKGFPLVGFIQTAIDKLGKNNAEVYVAILFTVYGELNVNALTIGLNNHNAEDSIVEGGLEGKLGAKLNIKLEIGLKIITQQFEAKTQLDANFTIDAYFTGKATFGVDDIGMFFQPQVDFSGLKGSLTIEGELSIKSELSWWKTESSTNGSKEWSGIIIDNKDNIGDLEKHYMLNFKTPEK